MAAPPSARSAFWAAATTPSAPALLGALLVAGLCFWASVALLTVDRLGGLPPGDLMRSQTDDYGRLTAVLLAHQAAPEHGPTVALMGASATRESVPSLAPLTAAAAARVGHPVAGLDLATSSLSLWEYIAVADALGDGFEGVLVLGISPRVLATAPEALAALVEQPRLGLRPPAFDDEVRRAGLTPHARYESLLLNTPQFFLARFYCLARAVIGPATYLRIRYRPGHAYDAERRAQHRARLAEQLGGYAANVQPNLERLGRLIERVRARGRVQIALVEVPVHPDERRPLYGEAVLADYPARIAAFAAAHGAHYWQLDAEAELTGADFHDVVHLAEPAARGRYARALGARVAAIFPDLKEAP